MLVTRKILSATTDLATAAKCSQISMISDEILANISDHSNHSRYQLNNAILQIAEALKCMNQYHIILLYGEFDIALIKNTYIPIIERASQKKLGVDFGVSCVIEQQSNNLQLNSLFVKGFDKRSQISIRRLYKNISIKSQCFDFSDAI